MKTRSRRFKDVLLALGASTRCDVALQRIQLQKFVYLQDVFSAVWREISRPPHFEAYDHGPYDKHIQNAVDALAFRGFVEITTLEFLQTRTARSSYRLLPAGDRVLSQLIANEEVLAEEFLLAVEIAKEITQRGWENVVKIVYSEPTYYFARMSEDRRVLPTNEPLGNQTEALAALFRASWAKTSDEPPSRASFVQMLFLVFDEIRSPSDGQSDTLDAIPYAV